MTSAPMEPELNPRSAEDDVPAGDLGVGGPADDAGDGGEQAFTRPGYAEEVDPAEGPVAEHGTGRRGDLDDPGVAPAG